MDTIRTAYELRNRLSELFSYILLSPPDFPAEDQTSLQNEFATLDALLEKLAVQTRDTDGQQWLTLARQEATEACAAFAAGDNHRARKVLQQSEEHVRNRFLKKRIGSSFSVGPDGSASSS